MLPHLVELTLIFPLLLLLAATTSGLNFAGYGQACKVIDYNSPDLLDPKFECDVGRGLSCQTYTQGKLCGCSGSLSFDRRSDECRRKVATVCHIPKDKEELSRLNFNHKCHENAECVIYSGTLLGGEGERGKDSKPVCLCKQGYVSTTDFSECRDPNGTKHFGPSLPSFILISALVYLLNRCLQR